MDSRKLDAEFLAFAKEYENHECVQKVIQHDLLDFSCLFLENALPDQSGTMQLKEKAIYFNRVKALRNKRIKDSQSRDSEVKTFKCANKLIRPLA